MLVGSLVAQSSPTADAPSWRLRGRVVDAAGAALSGACLSVHADDAWTTAGTLLQPDVRTDATGTFTLRLPAPASSDARDATLLVSIAAPGRVALTFAPNLISFPPPFVGGCDVALGDIVLPLGQTLRGRVVDADDRPVVGARITGTDPRMLMQRDSRSAWSGFRDGSRALSGADGSFELPGVLPVGARLSIEADGFYLGLLPLVTGAAPLSVTLSPSGFIAGVVQNADGLPTQSKVRISYELGDDPLVETSQPNGKFRISLRHRQRYVVSSGNALRAVLEGPQVGIMLTDAARTFRVRTIDDATSKAVERVTAAAMWSTAQEIAWGIEPHYGFESLARTTRSPGEIVLPGPSAADQTVGTVILKAPGYAEWVSGRLAWSDDPPLQVEARLVQESIIEGVVIDATSGEPVAGARLHLGDGEFDPWNHMTTTDRPGASITDADGRFRLAGLRAGTHSLQAVLLGRPGGPATEVEVGAGLKTAGVKVSLPAGGALVGKVTGVLPSFDWQLRARPSGKDEARWEGPSRRARQCVIAADGSYRLTGLAMEPLDLSLWVPHLAGRGGWIEVALGTQELVGAETTRDLDASAAKPGVIAGKVTLVGATVKPERLLVAAFRTKRPANSATNPFERADTFGPLDANGTFTLSVSAGSHRVELRDLASNTLLAICYPPKVGAGETANVELSASLTSVRVELKPVRDGGRLAASRLEVVVKHPISVDNPVWQARRLQDYDYGNGVVIPEGSTVVDLIVPTFPIRLIARSQVSRLQTGMTLTPAGVLSGDRGLGHVDLRPKAGVPLSVELEVEEEVIR